MCRATQWVSNQSASTALSWQTILQPVQQTSEWSNKRKQMNNGARLSGRHLEPAALCQSRRHTHITPDGVFAKGVYPDSIYRINKNKLAVLKSDNAEMKTSTLAISNPGESWLDSCFVSVFFFICFSFFVCGVGVKRARSKIRTQHLPFSNYVNRRPRPPLRSPLLPLLRAPLYFICQSRIINFQARFGLFLSIP